MKFCEIFIEKFDKKEVHKIVSLLVKFTNNFPLIEMFVKFLYLKKSDQIEHQNEKKKFITLCKDICNKVIFQNRNHNSDPFMVRKFELIESLLISLILEESKIIEEQRKSRKMTSFQSFNSVSSIEGGENIFQYMTPSIPLIRALLLELYLKIDNSKKYSFIVDNVEIKPVIKGVPGIIQIDKEMREYIISLVKFFENKLTENENKECMRMAYTIFSDYLENIVCLYKESNIQKRKSIKKDDIVCTFKHIFQSNKICTNFYVSFYQNFHEEKYIEAWLKELIEFLILNHPKPFIFSLLARLFDVYIEKFYEIMKQITHSIFQKFQSEKNVSHKQKSFYLNVINLLWLYHLLYIEQNIKNIRVDDFFMKLLKLITDNELIGLAFLFSSPFPKLKDKKSIYEIIIDIITVIKPDLTLFNEYLMDKEGKPLADRIDSYNFTDKGKYSKKALFVEYTNCFKGTLANTPRSMLIVTLRKIVNLIGNKSDTTKDKHIKDLIELIFKLHFKTQDIFQQSKSPKNAVNERGNQIYKNDHFLFQSNIEHYNNNQEETKKEIFDILKNGRLQEIKDHDYSEQIRTSLSKSTIPTFSLDSKKENNKEEDSFEECVVGNDCLLKADDKVIENNDSYSDSKEGLEENINMESFHDVSTPDLVLCVKRDLFLKHLSVFFKDVYFEDKTFRLMKKVYQYKILNPIGDNFKKDTVYDEDKIPFEYPIILRNYSFAKTFYPRIFLKQNLSFFSNPYFPKSNSYFLLKDKKLPNIDKKPIFPHFIQMNDMNFFFEEKKEKNELEENNKKEKEFEVELLFNQGSFYGKLRITSKFMLFVSSVMSPNDLENLLYSFRSEDSERIYSKHKIIFISNSNIEEILQRKFLFMLQAIEIFLLNGKNYFFNFFSIENCKKFLSFIKTFCSIKKEIIIEDPIEEFNKTQKYTRKWLQKEIDNFQYLLYLNKYGSRSYNDLNQYPIIPWISLQTKVIKDKNKIKITKRRFEYPISAQTDEGQKKVLMNYKNSLDDKANFPSHYRLHYSTWSYVIHFLFRLSPFTESQIKLQNGKFETPNRQFFSYEEVIEILTGNFDNRELLPENYIFPEYFYNLNKSNFGERNRTQLLVHNLVVPKTFRSPIHFIIVQRELMNSNFIKETINYWIDNVFGVTQDDFSYERMNTFHKYSYEKKNNLMNKKDKLIKQRLSSNEIAIKLRERIIRILSFGQNPTQIFNTLHPKWESKEKDEEHNKDEFYVIGTLIWRCGPMKKKIEEGKIIHLAFTYLKDQIYLILKNEKLSDALPYSLYIKVCKIENFEEISFFPIENIKLFTEKGNIPGEAENEKITVLNTKYALFDINLGNYFIVGRNNDNCLKIYQANKKKEKNINVFYSIQTKSLISALLPIHPKKCQKEDENAICITSFYSGHKDGKLIEWSIKYEERDKKKKIYIPKVSPKRDIIAHDNKMITAIVYIERHQLIVTCAEDGYIHIRKIFDFELINVIDSGSKYRGYADCFFSNNDLLYTKVYDKKSKLFYLVGYTLNGIIFSKTRQRIYYTVQVTEEGKVLCLKDKRLGLEILDPGNLEKSTEVKEKNKSLREPSRIVSFLYENGTKAICHYAYENSFLSRVIINQKELAPLKILINEKKDSS